MSTEENMNNTNGSPDFGLPGGYFARSAGSIFNKIEWDEEHKNYPVLYSLKNTQAFSTPNGYFQSGEAKLELLAYPALASVKKLTGFAVPELYFESAEIREMTSVLGEETNELLLFKTLSAIPKQNNFKVDENYFAVNEKLMYTLLKHEKQARIIDMFFSSKSYVAAAFVAICLGLWIYSFYIRPGQVEKDCGTIACVDRVDILESKNLESLDNEQLYELVKPADLEKRLDGKSAGTDKKTRQDTSLDDSDLDELPDDI